MIDFRVSFSGEAYVSSKFETQALSEKITSAIQIYSELHPKVGYFFDLAIKEKDQLKKFLYYFLVLEIHTHNVFKSLNYVDELKNLHNLPDRIANSAAAFLIDRQKEAKNLFQRFIWCSLLKWHEINDTDINTFKSVKLVRDKIYHGEEIDEKTLPIHQSQMLALKLMRAK